MNDRDRALIERVKNGLFSAQAKLVENDNGRATWVSGDPQPTDRLNAHLTVSKELIRQETGRSVVRDVLIREYEQEFSKDRFLSVSKDGAGISLTTKSEVEDGRFSSLSDLERFNSSSDED